jgi:hypothetical protein
MVAPTVARAAAKVRPTAGLRPVGPMAARTVAPVEKDLRTAAPRLVSAMAALTEEPTVVPKDLLMVELTPAPLTAGRTVALAGIPEGDPGVGDRAAAGRAPGSPALRSR